MRITTSFFASLLCLALAVSASGVASAQEGAGLERCKTVEFNQDVLKRFPHARRACLDVVDKGSDTYAILKADLLRIYSDDRVAVRPVLPRGALAEPRIIHVSKNRSVLVNGEPARVENLKPNQRLTVYVKVNEPSIALAPADSNELVEFEPLTPERQQANVGSALPDTGTGIPWLLLFALGWMLVIIGGVSTLERIYLRRPESYVDPGTGDSSLDVSAKGLALSSLVKRALAGATIIAFVLILSIISGCATAPDIRARFDDRIDFNAYKTYGFEPELGTDRAGYSSLITQFFKDAIHHEMDARGYQYAESQPELLINFSANVKEQSEVRSSPSMTYGYYGYRYGMYSAWPAYGTDVYTVQYKKGTANIDIVDARKKQMIWEGIAEGELQEQAMQDPKTAISKVVAAMFTKFPKPGPSKQS